jgi:ABC-type sulfate/molybdate transport systems ATPase subunit
MSFLQVKSISVKGPDRNILSNISFNQEKGEHVVIAGETGSGKSTLLKVVAGLAHPTSGNVFFAGERVLGPLEKLVPGHSQIAYLSQHFELPKFLRVEQVLAYANSINEEKANELYELCQVTHLLKRKTDQLSGGERQRIAMARLLTGSPELLLLDEPFSNLDMQHKNALKQIIADIVTTLDISFILVSHDPFDTLSWADRIIVLHDGEIVQFDTPDKIYNEPVDEYTAGLFGKYFKLDGELRDKLVNANSVNKTFFRAEDFEITSEENGHTVKGIVKRSVYYGSFYELETLIEGRIVYVRSQNGIPSGENINLKIRIDQLNE